MKSTKCVDLMNSVTTNRQRLPILIAAAAGIISAFIPWLTVSNGMDDQSSGEYVNGFHGFGIVAFMAFCGAGAIALTGNLAKPLEKIMWLAVINAGAMAFLFTVAAFVSSPADASVNGSLKKVGVGPGIWGALTSSAVIILFSCLFKKKHDKSKNRYEKIKTRISIPVTFLSENHDDARCAAAAHRQTKS